MKQKIILAIIACLLLLLGFLIYICFRPPELILFKWLDFFGFKYSIFKNLFIRPPSFFINNLPNALFCIFGYIFIYIIWSKNNYFCILYILLITLMSIIYEIISNDISDIITIIATFFLCLSLYMINFRINYEK